MITNSTFLFGSESVVFNSSTAGRSLGNTRLPRKYSRVLTRRSFDHCNGDIFLLVACVLDLTLIPRICHLVTMVCRLTPNRGTPR